MKLKIYFGGAISAGRERQPLYAEMVQFLESLGAEVLSAHVARPDVMEGEKKIPAEEIFRRDIACLENCHGMVAEVSTPSLGVGFEIATALQLERPVLCLCEQGIFLSRMLTGNPHPQLQVRFYRDTAEWREALQAFCAQVQSAQTLPRVSEGK
ncbi:MAG: nucleoside 2-deoxyribosyltransferase [candidate division KSB1 bacterium]|nr:nucleoside 2-deoxyribosyltransferase [candidate division KSB1 bacterium]MDZ7304283.1 nucleoside 2-deoxyribosyltransferase [candidate division KSB1 bacterium]MDZ7312918.1 nucleoside 2-deoxyribosyltransferase [candidate division KSB1 bacterium]